MMNRTHIFAVSGLTLAISACATSSIEPPAPEAGLCNAAAAQHLVGETATQSLAATAVAATGARAFRWIPENSAVTMDYRPDRLNIEFDSSTVVTAIRCG